MIRRSASGSALPLAMLASVLLALLGMSLLLLAAQEDQLAAHSRNQAALRHRAESLGAVARCWLDDPTPEAPWSIPADQLARQLRRGHVLLPGYTNAQEGTAPADSEEVDGSAGAIYRGGTDRIFDRPYEGDFSAGFWGRRETPDVLACADPELDLDEDGMPDCAGKPWLALLDERLGIDEELKADGHDPRATAHVEAAEIRVFRPPTDFDLALRHGVATVEVVAIHRGLGGRTTGQCRVREVLGAIELPRPQGPLETAGIIGEEMAARVHWGAVACVSDDPADRIDLPPAEGAFPAAAVPRIGPGTNEWHPTINTASRADLHAAARDKGPAPTLWANAGTELAGTTRNGVPSTGAPLIGDPWLRFLSTGGVAVGGKDSGPAGQPRGLGWKGDLGGTVRNGALDERNGNNWGHLFQRQALRPLDLPLDQWRQLAASGASGLHLLQWDEGAAGWRLQGRGPARSYSEWIDRNRGAAAGLWYFDTTDGLPPEDRDRDGDVDRNDNLAPPVSWEDGAFLEGFVIVLAEALEAVSPGEPVRIHAPMPGEPFLDDGIDLHAPGETDGDGCICARFDDARQRCLLGLRPVGHPSCEGEDEACACDAATLSAMPPDVAAREAATWRNGIWDSDLDGDGTSEAGKAGGAPGWDTFIASAHGQAQTPGTPSSAEPWTLDPRFGVPEGQAGDGPLKRVHEPFLNLSWPELSGGPIPWTAAAGVAEVDPDGHGRPIDCDRGDEGRTCVTTTKLSTRGRDPLGALVELRVHAHGLVYCEGRYAGGSLRVHGALVARAGQSSADAADIWFDDRLADGRPLPVSWRFPRVHAVTRDID